jgi:hypothetical protein
MAIKVSNHLLTALIKVGRIGSFVLTSHCPSLAYRELPAVMRTNGTDALSAALVIKPKSFG